MKPATQASAVLSVSKTAISWSSRSRSGERGAYRTSNQRTIARLRKGKGMTQPQAASYCGVPLRTFQRAEAGDFVSRDVERRILRAFGVFW